MRTVEIARSGDASVADQMADMHEWLRAQGMQPLELQPVRILKASVHFLARFANEEDAERFRLRFDEGVPV
jgi:hypothetical protein